MCTKNDGFKLCTCSDDIDIDKPHWVLERLKINKKDVDLVIIGTFSMNYGSNIDYVLDQLNNHNPFDFDYTPRNRDLLTLEFEKVAFHLFYYNKRWTDFYDYVGVEENQKEEIKKGILKGGLMLSDFYHRMWY